MKNEIGPFGIHWFRRDLRISGNAALIKNLKKHDGRVVGLFCFDSAFLARPDFSSNRFAFFLKTLRALKTELQEQGGDLLVVDGKAVEVFQKLPKAATVSFNRDYEPYARRRDSEVVSVLKKSGMEVITARDHVFFEPHEILKSPEATDFYQVFTPFSKKWFSTFHMDLGRNRLKEINQKAPKCALNWKELGVSIPDALDAFEKKNQANVTIPIPNAGHVVALNAVKLFKKHLDEYAHARDIPSIRGTSRLSIYFKNGSLTVPQAIQLLGLEDIDGKKDDSRTKYLKELIWREFYYSILWHKPEVEETAFNVKYKDLDWENNKEHFEHWKNGTTGFPIVDAGMRELKQTGWMHNRVRMIVASFLTKDLMIDWKWGERYFMEQLLDGDLAPNNGGWQWAASTGCDPQPYFRVFNPWLQSSRFDPEAIYIKKYIPELQNASAKLIHDEEGDRSAFNYPAPIVEHSVQRDKAIAMYKK